MIFISLLLAIVCGLAYCLPSFINSKQISQTTTAVRTIEVKQNEIDFQASFEQFDSVSFVPDAKLSTLNLVQTVDEEFLSEINNNSSTTHYKGEVCYDIEYDHENGRVYLNATLYLDDEGNCLFEKAEGVACWNENINDIDIVFEAEDDIIFLSDLNEDINNCGWFKKALKFVKKHAVAIVATVAVVAVAAVATVVVATCGAGLGACIAAGAIAGGITGGVAGGIISYSEYGKLDWRWIAGGVVIGAAIGAITGWGVGSLAMKTPTAQTNRLINSAQNGKLDFSNSIKNKSYFQKGSCDYRQYYEQTNLISQEIMKAKPPVVESGTNYLKWTVEGIQQTAKGTTYGKWELIIDPVKEVIVHFLFAS